MNYIHDKGFAHRDIKLQNFFLDQKLNIKLGDYGFCVELRNSGLKTSCGTKMYMAPEMLDKKDGCRYDGRSTDIFSMGVVLFTLLTGEIPFFEALDECYRKLFFDNANARICDKFKMNKKAFSLILGMIDKDPAKRMKMEDIKNHPWLEGTEAD